LSAEHSVALTQWPFVRVNTERERYVVTARAQIDSILAGGRAGFTNLANGAEESKMLNAEARTSTMNQRAKPVFSLADLESGKIAINPDGLEQVWGKWPGATSRSRNCLQLCNTPLRRV